MYFAPKVPGREAQGKRAQRAPPWVAGQPSAWHAEGVRQSGCGPSPTSVTTPRRMRSGTLKSARAARISTEIQSATPINSPACRSPDKSVPIRVRVQAGSAGPRRLAPGQVAAQTQGELVDGVIGFLGADAHLRAHQASQPASRRQRETIDFHGEDGRCRLPVQELFEVGKGGDRHESIAGTQAGDQ